MNNRNYIKRKSLFFSLLIAIFIVISCGNRHSNSIGEVLAINPPMGWNSFDSYGVYLHEEAAMDNLEAFAQKLKPYGYEYFVMDAGWFGEFELREGTLFPAEKHAKIVNINEFGLLQPSETYFPNGLQPIIDRCHELGIKFGIHLMRGIPRLAAQRNTIIKGTNIHAQEIIDTVNVCKWNPQNYGIDMSKPGAQEFYNSLINQLAAWGVDFIKYDDIVPYPEEVEAVTKAIAQNGRPIVLSLSPGNSVREDAINFYKKAHMLRVTSDIWDDQKGIDKCFSAWKKWQGNEQPGFWIDMDMIPFGQLQLMNPEPKSAEGKDQYESKEDKENLVALAGHGHTRWSNFSKDQMYTFITMRAMAASPLMMGGDLPTLDDFSFTLITNEEIIACNQNGIMGHLVYDKKNLEIWNTPKKGNENGWIGVFNRSKNAQSILPTPTELGLSSDKEYALVDIWNQEVLDLKNSLTIQPNGAVFIKYLIK
ncbi:MAG: glycoside hydrolase family 27 protein [Arenibacter algicola]